MSNIFYNQKRNRLIKKLTGNLGEVVEQSDRLVCYVDVSEFEKDGKNILYCHGISIEDRELARKYNLDKQICYVIDGFNSQKEEICIIEYYQCEIIIKNCNFNHGLEISTDGKCTIEDTVIKNIEHTIKAKNLTISGTTITASKRSNIEIESKNNLEIYNSNIGKVDGPNDYNASDVNITVEGKLEVHYSKIEGKNVNCKVKRYALFDKASSIIATFLAFLKIPDYNEINITTYTLISNGVPHVTSRKPMLLRQKRGPLSQNRLALVKLLDQLKDKGENANAEALKEAEDTIKKRPLSKVLARHSTTNQQKSS